MLFPERNNFMQKDNGSEKKSTFLWLVLIYTGSVVIRYILALATRNFPTVYIDEYLYYSIGRSIATEGSMLYFGQPAVYNYIIYPLILSPVYLLFGHGADYFRLIQLWNILLMTLSAFPIFGLCNAMVQKRKTALWMTALFMMMPCFILGEFVFSEAIIYPLFFTLMYCVYQNIKENRIKYPIWIGVLGALLYYSKPGAVVPTAVALLFLAIKAVKEKNGKAGIQVLAGVGCLTVLFFVIKLITEQVLGYQGSTLSVYEYQSSFADSISNDYFFKTVYKYPYYFMLAGSILPFTVSLWKFSGYDRNEKEFYLFAIICSALTMIGTAWVTNRPEQKEILFLRYVEMYLPVLFIFIMIPPKDAQAASGKSGRVISIMCIICLLYTVVCTVVWGSTTGIGEQKETHFLISLSALFSSNVMGTANIIIVLLAGVTLYLLVRKTKEQTIRKICCVTLVLFTVLHSIAGYVLTGRNTNKKLLDETAEIHQMLGDKEYVHVYDTDQCDYGLDINSRQNICRVTETDFVNSILKTHGYYTPLVPSSSRGMESVYETPDTDTLIIDENIYKKIRFSDRVSQFISSEQSFDVIRFSKGERIIDCLLSRINTEEDAKETYALIVYNEDCLIHPVRINLEIESPVEQEMNIRANGQHTVTVQEGRYWYEITTTDPATEYILSAKQEAIQIHDYKISIITE